MTATAERTSSTPSAPCTASRQRASPRRRRASPRRSIPCPARASPCCSAATAAAFSFPPDLAASFGANARQALALETRWFAARHAVPAHAAPSRFACLSRQSSDVPQFRLGRHAAKTPITPSSPLPTPSSPPRTRSTWSPRQPAPASRSMCSASKAARRGSAGSTELMRERGATRPFEGKLEAWSYAPINDTEIVACAIRRALGLETLG